MLYALLLYGDEIAYDELPPDQLEADMAAHGAFYERHSAAIRGGEALQPTATATTVRRPGDAERLLTDGPFAETREQLGGFYIVDVPGLDEALAMAEEVPMGPGGSVEVRPVMAFDEPGS